MRTYSNLVLLSLALMLLISSSAFAVGPVHDFDCKKCHITGGTINQLGGSNVCLQCHGDPTAMTAMFGRAAAQSDGGFVTADASNRFAAVPAPPAGTSHNWAATSTRPEAGAAEPNRTLHPGFYGRYGATLGKVACSRCHNPHGDSVTNPQLLPLTSDYVTPMTPNDMCKACHAVFAGTGPASHGLLSHPVGMNYAASVALPANAGKYKATIDNGTSGALTLMADGTVSCTTCHGVHAVDSDADTSDGFATLPVVATGDGLLLKHSGPGKENPATDSGICQACHEYKGHGMAGVNQMGCMVCHGGHENDAVDPNYYMLKKQVALDYVPKLAGPGTVTLSYTSLTTNWQNAGAGFCESCHTLPLTVAEHTTGVPQDGAFCSSCHKHETDSGSFGGACNSCHGYAPNANVQGGPNGYAYVDATHDYNLDANKKDESLTAHAKHAVVGAGNYSFACQECHSNFTPSGHPALDNNYQDVAFAGGLAETGGITPTAYVKAGTGTCATLYCHSDGVNTARVVAGPIAKTIPTWQGGATTCTSCHNNSGAGTTGTAVVHKTHLALTLKGSAVTCGTCHNATWAAANTLKTKADGSIVAAHVDGDVDVEFNTTLVPTAPMDQTAGTCAVYCHSNGTAPVQTPDWDDVATGDCGDCHAVNAGTLLTGSHATHLTLGYACNTCHTHDGSAFGGDHIDGAKNVTPNVCNTCHGATAGQSSGPDRVPSWGISASVDCETCHAGSAISQIGVKNAPNKNQALLTGHNLASGNYALTNNSAAAQACTACHDAAAAGHFDGVSGDDTRLAGGFDCLSCHDGSSAKLVKTHTNIGATIKTEADFTKLCLDCHDPHGAAVNAAMISVPGVVFTARTNANSFDELDSGAGANADDICATCHVNTSHNNTAVTGSHNENANCMACHSHGGGFMATGGSSCEDCHSAKLAEPRHAKHINISPDVDTDKSECAICHPSVAGYTITGGSADHFNSTANDFAAGITNPQAAGTTCSSAMGCHLSTVGDGSWQDTDGLNCNACHYQAADPTQAGNTGDAKPVSAGHNPHFAGGGAVVCTNCHNAVVDTTHISSDAGTDAFVLNDKANALQDEAEIAAAATFNDVANTCSTASCHNNGRPGTSVTTSAWGTNDANCTSCHLASPTTGSHSKHIPDAANCSTCHTSALKDTSYNSGNHYDGNIDVAVGGYPTDKAINSAFTNCTTASCHDDGRAPNATPDWGTAVTTCLACHEAVPSTGSHASHVADAAVTCTDCHAGAVQATTVPTVGHRDGNIDVTGGSGYPINRALSSAFTNCTTASCHNDGRNSGVTGTWGTTINNCAECHATVPTTGGHGAHVGVSFAGSAIACTDCHAGAVQGTTAPTTGHRDGNIDATGYAVSNKTLGSAFTTCNTASCHQTGQATNDYVVTPAWDANTPNCSQCHAALPATGSHTKHLTVVSNTCWSCHGANALAGTSYIDANHGDLNVDVVIGGYTADKALGAPKESCTYSCHSDGMAADGTSPIWGTATAACTSCHLSDMVTGSHGAHLTDGALCGDCHDGAVKGSNFGTAHTDGNVDVIATYATANAAYGSASWTTCSAASCHDDGRAPNVSAVWGTTVNNCAECHATQPGTGSHAIHLTDGATCGDCHAGSVEGTTAPTANHRDGNVNAGGGYPVQAKGSAYTSCTTASCHDDGRSANTTPNWGTAAANACVACHDAIPATGSHVTHVADAAVSCTDCHAGAVQATTEPTAGHRDDDIDTTAAHGYTQNKTKGSAFTTCSTASCHNDGRNAGLTAAWGSSLANCAECHAVQPATGSHTTHLALYACATCHTGVTEGTTAGAGHRDGNIDVAAATGLATNKTLGSAFVSCSTNNCHGSNSPVWGTDLSANDACTQCHGELVAGPATDAQKAPGGAGVDTNGDSAATDAQVGAHQIHLNPTYSKPVACVACHVVPATLTAAGHIDSALPAELTWTGLSLGGLDGQAAVVPTNCSTTYCHDGAAIKNGMDGGTLAPVWTNTSFIQGTVADCDNCHGYPPAGSHVANTDCSACHDVLLADDLTFSAAGKLTHIDGIVQASGGDNCTDCHGADIDNALNGSHGAHTDTATFLAGKTISGGDYGAAGWYTTTYVNGKPNFGCGQCHPSAEGTGHPTNGLNVDIAQRAATVLKEKNNVTTSLTRTQRTSVVCASVYCHSNGEATPTFVSSPNWFGGTVTGNCNDCHGNSPDTNAHQVHEVGIHYTELYDPTGPGLLTAAAAPGSNAAHGDPAMSTTINCYTCHSGTVTDSANAANDTCVGCHSDTNSIATGNEKARILTTSSTHVNGIRNVAFADLTVFKSKAQLRDSLADADDGTTILSTIWTRLFGYKAADNSHDDSSVQAAFSAGSCSNVSCHNGNDIAWTARGDISRASYSPDCMACHTSLPK